jgi:hypothetical protein
MAATWADPTATWAVSGWSWSGAAVVVPDVNATSATTVTGFATSTVTLAGAATSTPTVA